MKNSVKYKDGSYLMKGSLAYQLYDDAGGVTVRAGCFIGTAEEFCKKAAIEDKLIYVSVVSAIIEVW